MSTCFLFAETLDETHCTSLRFDESGALEAPLAVRSVEDFHQLQQGAKTHVVIPTHLCSVYELELPKLSDAKARAVIPYALEEQLATPVGDVHIAFMRQPGKPNLFLVIVLDKQVMRSLLERLESWNIRFDDITIDWFALNEGEAFVVGHECLLHDAAFKGALGINLLSQVFKAQEPLISVMTFHDSAPLAMPLPTTLVSSHANAYIAERLLGRRFLNLCQGDFEHHTDKQQTRRWFLLAGGLIATWFVVTLLLKALLFVSLKHQDADEMQQINALYHAFFPDARVVVSPRFRIEQLLKQNQAGTDALLWRLLAKLSIATTSHIDIQSLRFQTQSLVVNLRCDDFATLEQFENQLHRQQVTVRQLSAAKSAKGVTATLELK